MTLWAYSRYEPRISSVTSMSTMFSSNSSGGGAVVPLRRGGMRGSFGLCGLSGVDAGQVELGGAVDDEITAGRHVGAHQQVEHALGGGAVFHPDPAQGAVPRVHGGVGELLGVHLAEALVALDRLLEALALALQPDQRAPQLGVGVGVDVLVLPLARVGQLDPVQRRDGGVHPARV